MLDFYREKKIEFKKIKEELNLNKNNIIVQDNIHLLYSLKQQDKIMDMIYIDPPYNTKKNELTYQDNRELKEWIKFIHERLLIAKDILSEKGVILVSIDDNHYAYLKLIMDDIFGIKNFVCNFIWKKSHTVKNDKKGISTQQEYVICFAKNIKEIRVNREPTSQEYIKKAYRNKDIRGAYRVVPLHKDKNKTKYKVIAPNGKVWEKGWNYNKEGFEELRKNDLLYWGKEGNSCPSKKVYLKENMTKTYGSILPETVKYTGDGKKALKNLGFEGNVFSYAKPVELIEHFITIFTDKESVILDFFAGSGTTAESVISKNIKDNGNRKFILGTNNEEEIATKITIPRVKKVFEKNNINIKQLTIYNEKDFK